MEDTQWIDHYWFYLKGTLNEISLSSISTCPHLSISFSLQAGEKSLQPSSPAVSSQVCNWTHKISAYRSLAPKVNSWAFTANASTIQLGGVLSGLWSTENGHFVSSVVIPLTHTRTHTKKDGCERLNVFLVTWPNFELVCLCPLSEGSARLYFHGCALFFNNKEPNLMGVAQLENCNLKITAGSQWATGHPSIPYTFTVCCG